MFKILQAFEKGTDTLTVVPGSWESKGHLFWPKHNAHKLIKRAESIPEDNWFIMNCNLKMDNISNYNLTKEKLEKMLVRERG